MEWDWNCLHITSLPFSLPRVCVSVCVFTEGKTPDPRARTYKDAMMELALRKEEVYTLVSVGVLVMMSSLQREVREAILKKASAGELPSKAAPSKVAERKRKRWDQQTPSHDEEGGAMKKSAWDQADVSPPPPSLSFSHLLAHISTDHSVCQSLG